MFVVSMVPVGFGVTRVAFPKSIVDNYVASYTWNHATEWEMPPSSVTSTLIGA